MTLPEERSGFKARLRQALDEANLSHLHATDFAREFNVRYAGNPIAINTARKWLLADALPTQEKLRTLATWLGVRTEWLRFGIGPQHPEFWTASGKQLDSEARLTLTDLKHLNAHQRLLVHELVKMLLRELP